jgi:hypothetical protein
MTVPVILEIPVLETFRVEFGNKLTTPVILVTPVTILVVETKLLILTTPEVAKTGLLILVLTVPVIPAKPPPRVTGLETCTEGFPVIATAPMVTLSPPLTLISAAISDGNRGLHEPVIIAPAGVLYVLEASHK